MKYVLAIMWALSLVLVVFGNREGSAYGGLLFIITLAVQILYWIGQIGETIGQAIVLRMEAKYAQQQIINSQRDRELDLLEKIANK